MQRSIALARYQKQRIWTATVGMAIVCLSLLLLVGCKIEFAAADCKRISNDVLQVGANATCKFRYGYSDVARYVVTVTRAPTHGQATAQGAFLQYVAKPGFVGDDQMRIKVERRGVGHLQWQDITVKVKVGSDA